jgi:glucose/arabinose dehydrogenase
MKIAIVALICASILSAGLVTHSRGFAAGSAVAQSMEPQAIELEPVLSGLTNPLFLTSAHDGSDRIFVVEQPGRIRVLQPNNSTTTVFLDIRSRVKSGGEQGLLGLAFHPQYTENRRFFVDYTRQPDGATVIAEYHASASDPNLADSQETVLLVIPQPFANHNGGMVEFGPDGFLYIGMGDGGSANDPGNRAQNTSELLGKILRIDVDHPAGGSNYSSPSDNPFFGAAAGRDEIYALGLRNPFRFSFDRRTGDLIAGDVGQGAWEEVDVVTKGGNYGWRIFEGNHCSGNDQALCAGTGFTPPILEYSHSSGRCSITGGYVYRGTLFSLPFGDYVFGDFCTGEIFLLENGVQTRLLDTSLSISSFGEDEAGEIYVVDLGGTVSRLVNPNPPPPSGPLEISGAFVRRRSTGRVLDPLKIKKNGKKFEIVVAETSTPTAASPGSVILVNGVELNTVYTLNEAGAHIFVARLKRGSLSEQGPLLIEVIRPDGEHSNQLTLEVGS